MTPNPLSASAGDLLTPLQRERFAQIADVLIVGVDGFPNPSEIGIHNTWIDLALTTWPAMQDVVRAVTDMEGDAETVVSELRTSQPQLFAGFGLITGGAYFMHPKVRALLSYPTATLVENPPLEGEWEYYLEDGLLDPVIQRGAFMRPVPEA